MFLRSVLVAIIVYLYAVYDENPPVISVVMGCCFVILIVWGDMEIVLYDDKLVTRYSSIFRLLWKHNRAVLFYKDIKEVSVQVNELGQNRQGSMGILFLRSVRDNEESARIHFDMKYGDSENIYTSMTLEKGAVIVEHIKAEINRNGI